MAKRGTMNERARFAADRTTMAEPGTMTRPLGRFEYDANPNSPWAASSTNPEGQWARGIYLFGLAPALVPPPLPIMYDPTNPATWGKPRA